MTNLELLSRLAILYTIVSEMSTINLKYDYRSSRLKKHFFISLDRIVRSAQARYGFSNCNASISWYTEVQEFHFQISGREFSPYFCKWRCIHF